MNDINDITVVFIHGFMGCPAQFDDLLPVAQACGCETEVLLLPGHGCSVSGFAAAHCSDWLTAVDERLLSLRDSGRRVVAVTHSMGGLLAINTAIAHPDSVSAIISLALPLKLRITGRALRTWVTMPFSSAKITDKRILAARTYCGVSGISVFNSIRMLPNTIELLRLIRQVRGRISSLTVPLHFVNSSSDEMVSPRAALFAHQTAGNIDEVLLHRSGHFWYPPEEQKHILALLRDVLSELL